MECEKCREHEQTIEQLELVIRDLICGLERVTGNAKAMYTLALPLRDPKEAA